MISSLFLIALASAAAVPCTPQADSTAVFFESLRTQSTDSLEVARKSRCALNAGLAALELYRRNPHPELAVFAARKISDAYRQDRDDAWVHFGIGLLLQRAPKTMAVIRARGVDEGEAAHVARRHLEAVLLRSPDHRAAAEVLLLIARRMDDEELEARATRILRRQGRAMSSPAVLLSELERAKQAFAERRDADGMQVYFSGMNDPDSTAAQAYIADAALIANAEEAKALYDLTVKDLQAKLQEFWKKRAARDGISLAERVGIHYRRMSEAADRFRLSPYAKGAPSFGGVISARSANTQTVDDRGIVFIRYGEPHQVYRAIGPQFLPNETWAYAQPNGFLVFRFAATGARSGFTLIADARDAIQLQHDAQLRGDSAKVHAYSEDAAIVDFFSSQGQFTHAYASLAAQLQALRALIRMPEERDPEEKRRRVREAIQIFVTDAAMTAGMELLEARKAVTTDDASPRFKHRLVAFQDVATFRGSSCTDMLYTVSAAASHYRLRVSVFDSTLSAYQGLDTIVFAPAESAAGQLRASGWICVPASRAVNGRIALSTNDSTGVSSAFMFAVPSYTADSLMMSDIVIALPEDGPLVRGKARLALAPPRQFRQNETFRVFYELYNLKPGAEYRTQLTLTVRSTNALIRLFKGKRELRLSFDGAAGESGVMQEIRDIMAQIEPGEVQLDVTVIDKQSGAAVSKRKTVWITPASE